MFLTELDVRVLESGTDFLLLSQFVFNSSTLDFDDIIVPSGFVTDFTSGNILSHIFVPRTGKYTKASVIHDFMLKSPKYSKCQADIVFHEALLLLEVNRFKARGMFLGVKYGNSEI